MRKTDLAVHILKDSHGELVAAVGECLIHRGSLTLKQLEQAAGINQAKIQKALLILIQHGMVEYHQNHQKMVEYRIYKDRVIYQIYTHKEVQCAGLLYGDAAEIMVEELLQEGRLPMHTLVDSVTNKLNEAIKAQGADLREVQPSYVQDKFERLVATHFIKRCSVPVKNDRGRVVALEPLQGKIMFTVPPKSAAGGSTKVKQEPAEEGPPAKKPRLSEDVSQQGSPNDTETIYWEVNHQRFLHHFRDQMLVSAVAKALDSEKAAEVMRTILRHCEKTTDPNTHTTLPVSFNEIHFQLPKDKAMTRQTLEQWLKLMTDSMPEFISKVGESGGGMYIVNTFKALKAICTAHIESVVEEKHGSKARRLIEVVVKNKHVSQDMLESCVLMPGKQTRDLLSWLITENFIYVTELTKPPDSIFHLVSIDVMRVARMLLETSYLSLKNLMLSRQHILSNAKRLLEKQERIEAIIVSLGLPASYAHGEEGEGMEVDDEKKEQVDAIMETITPAEQQHLKRVKALTQHFEVAEQSLAGSTIIILESFLALTYNPPVPKPSRNLLD